MHSDHATWETGLVIPENTKTPEERILDALQEIQRTLEMFRVDFLRTRREQILDVEMAKSAEEITETATKTPKGKKGTNGGK